MFFYLSKVLMFLIEPGNFLFLLLLLGVAFLWLKKQRLGKILCSLAFVFYAVFGLLPFGVFLLDTLENRFPAVKEIPENVDGIIVLGGVLDVVISEARGRLALNGNIERIISLINLTKKSPNATVIFTGGAGLLGRPDLSEADMLKPLLNEFMHTPDKIIFENKSRNTFQNAVFTKELIQQKPGETWLLVTSAFHMPRSVGIFRRQGIEVTPYPVDFDMGPDVQYGLQTNPRASLGHLRKGLHEWLGLLAYYWTDKTSEFFPSP